MRREGFYAKRKPFRRAVRARGVAHKIHRFEFYAVDQQEGGVDFEVIPTSISANPSPPVSGSLAHREGLDVRSLPVWNP